MNYEEIFESYNIPCKVIKQDNQYLFKTADIGKLLQMANIRCLNINQDYKRKIKLSTAGGEQNMAFLTENGVKQVLSKTRKGKARLLADIFGVSVLDQISPPIETQTIENIMKVFKNENMIQQYKVDSYRIDLYFPKYRLAIECDEKHHQNFKDQDQQRQSYITCVLGCTFIRYKPFDYNFNIFDVINQIHKHIVASSWLCTTSVGCQTEETEFQEPIEKPTADDTTLKFNQFIHECCYVKDHAQISSSDIQGAYRLWARKAEKETFLALNDFLKTKFKPCRLRIQNRDKVVNGFDGLCLKETEESIPLSCVPSDPELFLHQHGKRKPGGNVLINSLVKEYIEWKKRMNKCIKTHDEEKKELKVFLQDKTYALQAVVWNIHGNGVGYYGIQLNSEDMYCAKTSSTAKKVEKRDTNGFVLNSWSTVAKAAQSEGISAAKLSRIIKQGIKHNDFFFVSV